MSDLIVWGVGRIEGFLHLQAGPPAIWTDANFSPHDWCQPCLVAMVLVSHWTSPARCYTSHLTCLVTFTDKGKNHSYLHLKMLFFLVRLINLRNVLFYCLFIINCSMSSVSSKTLVWCIYLYTIIVCINNAKKSLVILCFFFFSFFSFSAWIGSCDSLFFPNVYLSETACWTRENVIGWLWLL